MIKNLIKSTKFWRSVFGQGLVCSIILWLYCFIGIVSPNHHLWDDVVLNFVKIGVIIFSAFLIATLVLYVLFQYLTIRSEANVKKVSIKEFLFEPMKVKGVLVTALILVVLIIVSTIIRIQLLGSYQIGDGIEYYYQIRTMTEFPQWYKTPNFFFGMIAGHIAYGFIFLSTFGQLFTPYTEMGFQYSYIVLGVISTCCFYGIFRKTLKNSNKFACGIAAFIVGIQPLFFGLSTLCQMEFPLAAAFIIVVFCYVYKQYILMIFWLVVLGTCKETGLLMSLYAVGMLVLLGIIKYIVSKGGPIKAFKSLNIFAKLLVLLTIYVAFRVAKKVLYMKLWGVRAIDILLNRTGTNMAIRIDPTHFKLKTMQLFILNFSWITAIVIIIGLIINFAVPAIRKKKLIDGYNLAFILGGYILYTAVMLFLPEAKVPRYNTLSDVLFLFLGMLMLLKLFDSLWKFITPAVIIGALMFVESFLTIDPISRAVFTNVNTNGIPMVWCGSTKADMPIMDRNIGDLGYYNYQYSFVDKAVDIMLKETNFQDWYFIVSAFRWNVEDPFKNTQLVWNMETQKRKYAEGDPGYCSIRRVFYESTPQVTDDEQVIRALWVELPTCENFTDAAYEWLSKDYDISEIHTVSVGLAGSIQYRWLYKK